MAKAITGKKFATNVIVSIAAQIISLAVSVILNLVVPKLIDQYQYSYWQTYVLYAGYVGVLHFGLLDGLVLRYSRYDYEELDKARLRSQFAIMLFFTSAVTVIGAVVSAVIAGGVYRYVAIFVAVAVVTKNVVTYSSYMFQITNRISKYAVLIIAQRMSYGLVVVILLSCGVGDFYWYCIADLIGDLIGIAIGFIYNRGLYFGKTVRLREAFKELKANISSGILLMLANWSAMLIVGGAKMIIQWRWDEITFAKASFAFSVANLFLVFVTAISVVLFPSLKRVDEDKLPAMYKTIRDILSPLLFFCMIFYFLGCWLLKLWLPKYSDSLIYLGLLLPIIIYSSKVSLLTNNYLKVYRKEKVMLIVNLISIALGAIAFSLSAYVFDSLYAVLISVVCVIMFNSVLSEICVLRVIKTKLVKDFIIEGAMTAGFILAASLLNLWMGCLVYCAMFALYCLINYKSIASTLKLIFNRKKEKEQ